MLPESLNDVVTRGSWLGDAAADDVRRDAGVAPTTQRDERIQGLLELLEVDTAVVSLAPIKYLIDG